MTLTSSNYHSSEANVAHWSVSSFKAFDKCEASGLAQVRGQYERELTDSLLFGSYVDAYFTDDKEVFMQQHGDLICTKKGTLYAKFEAPIVVENGSCPQGVCSQQIYR